MYLKNWLIQAKEYQQCEAYRNFTPDLANQRTFVFNLAKSYLTLTQSVVWLGMEWDSRTAIFLSVHRQTLKSVIQGAQCPVHSERVSPPVGELDGLSQFRGSHLSTGLDTSLPSFLQVYSFLPSMGLRSSSTILVEARAIAASSTSTLDLAFPCFLL